MEPHVQTREDPATQPRLGRDTLGAVGAGVRWELCRNCAMSPQAALGAIAVLVAMGVAIGVAALWVGYPVVTGFAVLVQVGVVSGFVVYARHACDRDVLTLDAGGLRLQRRHGEQVLDVRFDMQALQVHLPADNAGPWLVDRVRRIDVGRHVPLPARTRLAHELRMALRAQRMTGPWALAQPLPEAAR